MRQHPRRCFVCGQPVPHDANGCPSCGSALPSAPAAGVSTNRKHPQVVAAVITFCVGLLFVRFLVGYWGPGRLSLGSGGFESLRMLEFIAIIFSICYIILRESEGDFRALFLVALALYAGEETLVFCANTFWIGSFHSLGILTTFAACIYSALALIAAVYDPPGTDPYRPPLLVACLAILLVSAIRALGTLPLPPFDRYQHALGIAVIIGAGIYFAAVLLKTWAARLPQ